jgi:hypothetical protein
VIHENESVTEITKEISVPAYGENVISFSLDTDVNKGDYTIDASLLNTPFGEISSIRDYKIK